MAVVGALLTTTDFIGDLILSSAVFFGGFGFLAGCFLGSEGCWGLLTHFWTKEDCVFCSGNRWETWEGFGASSTTTSVSVSESLE